MRIRRLPVFLLPMILLAGCTLAAVSPSESKNTITNRGSDTLVNLALAWAEAYAEVNPDIRISVTGGGSGTGISALINGTVDIANASRAMKSEEIAQARDRGIEPNEIVVARDAIAVIINPANPVDRLTLQQISDIFTGRINNWREVGGEDRPIVRVSREVNSGTHVYFLESVIRLGEKDNKDIFAADTLLLSSSEGITAEVSQNPNAIGYDGLGYVVDSVKMVAVGENPEGPYYLPSKETVKEHQYLISRELYMYVDGEPAGTMKDYLDWILQPDAQAIVASMGFIPIQ
jgi:phosphate transport system substrate-binding protein